jgi:plastocyanin
MSNKLLLAILDLTLFASCGSFAQTQTVTAHIDVVRSEARSKANDSSNVVVWLTPVAPAANIPSRATTNHIPRLVQKGKAFSPHILVVPVGSVVEFPNRDPFFHNVFSLFEGKRFDLGLYESGGTRLVHFDRAGVSYIFCNIHPEMSAIILVVDSPYYALSKPAGDISIPDVRPGQYVLHIWGEGSSPEQLRGLTKQVTVSETVHDLGSFRLTETPALRVSHSNKYDQPYESASPSSPIYVQR